MFVGQRELRPMIVVVPGLDAVPVEVPAVLVVVVVMVVDV